MASKKSSSPTTAAANDVDRPRSWARLGVEAGYLVLSTLLFLALNEVFKANYPDTLLEGSPEWSWMAGAFTQTTIFPGAVLVSYCRSGADFDNWLVGNVKSSSRKETLFSFPMERLFYLLFIGYIAKDFFVDMSLILIIHHIGCFLPATYLYFTKLRGIGACDSLICLMELGSFCYGLSVHTPCTFTIWVYHVGQTASNVLGFFFQVRYLQIKDGKRNQRIVICVVVILLTLARQGTIFGWM